MKTILLGVLVCLPVLGTVRSVTRYPGEAIELLDVVALCPTEYQSLRDAGWLGRATLTQTYTVDSKQVLDYQLSAVLGDGRLQVASLEIRRTAVYSFVDAPMGVPMEYKTECIFSSGV